MCLKGGTPKEGGRGRRALGGGGEGVRLWLRPRGLEALLTWQEQEVHTRKGVFVRVCLCVGACVQVCCRACLQEAPGPWSVLGWFSPEHSSRSSAARCLRMWEKRLEDTWKPDSEGLRKLQ